MGEGRQKQKAAGTAREQKKHRDFLEIGFPRNIKFKAKGVQNQHESLALKKKPSFI